MVNNGGLNFGYRVLEDVEEYKKQIRCGREIAFAYAVWLGLVGFFCCCCGCSWFFCWGQILRESCWVFSSDIINAACSMPEFILAGSKLLTQFSILLKFVFSAIMQVDGIWL